MNSICANGREWRCSNCDALLGVHRGSEVHIRYKEHQAVVIGRVRIACRRCGTANETVTLPPDGWSRRQPANDFSRNVA